MAPLPCFQHLPQLVLHAKPGSLEIDADEPVPNLVRGTRAFGRWRPSTAALLKAQSSRPQRSTVRPISCSTSGLRETSAGMKVDDARHHPRGFGPFFGIDIGDDDPGSGSGKGQSGGPADSGPTSGDQGDSVSQRILHPGPSSRGGMLVSHTCPEPSCASGTGARRFSGTLRSMIRCMPGFVFLLSALILAGPAAGRVRAQDGPTGADWPHYGGSYQFWRYSSLDQVNRKTVKKLVPVWAFQTGIVDGGLQATPIVLDGVMYLTSSWNRVFAIDAATGDEIWHYYYENPRQIGIIYSPWNRGVAVSGPRVFHGHPRQLCRGPGPEDGTRVVEGQRRGSETVRLQHHRGAAGGEGQGDCRRHRGRLRLTAAT